MTIRLLILLLIFASQVVVAKPLTIISSTAELGSIAKAVGGDAVVVDSLIYGSRDMHQVDPKPSMIVRLRRADLLIRTGMSEDSWVDGLLYVARKSHLRPGNDGYLDVSLDIDKLGVPTGHIDGRYGDIHSEGNPHFLYDPLNAVAVAGKIRDRLKKLDPTNSAKYDDGFDAFRLAIDSKLPEWQSKLQHINGQYVVSFHEVWPYLAQRFGFHIADTIEPVPGISPTPRHIVHLHHVIKDKHVVGVMMARYYNTDIGKKVAKEAGISFLALPTSLEPDNGIHSYIDLMDYIITMISETFR